MPSRKFLCRPSLVSPLGFANQALTLPEPALTIETGGAIAGPLVRNLKLLKEWLLVSNQRRVDADFVKAFAVLLPHWEGTCNKRHSNQH